MIKNVAFWLLKISHQLQPLFQNLVWTEENQLSVTLDSPSLVEGALRDGLFRDSHGFIGVSANGPQRTVVRLHTGSTPALSLSAQTRIWRYRPNSSFLKMVQKLSRPSIPTAVRGGCGRNTNVPETKQTEHAKRGELLHLSC